MNNPLTFTDPTGFAVASGKTVNGIIKNPGCQAEYPGVFTL
jgi:hypothetical protein